MTLTLNKIVTGLVGLAMVAGLAAAFTAERAHAAEMSLSDLVDLFIALEIIPADQADAARAAVEDMDEPAAPAMSCSFTRNLSTGDTGADVMDLQKLLNANGFQVAAAGAGSPGMETQYYGPATAAAVASMQEAFAADILTPLGLTSGTGYFGASTRAAANELCAAAGDDDDDDMPTIPTLPGDDDDDDDEPADDDDDMNELSGEGTLKTYELDDADDTDIMEGEEDAVIGVLTLEAEDGDILLERATFEIVGDSTDEKDPWDVFETFSLWYDGEMIAEFMADDEDDYLNEDDGEFRFSGLDFVLEEDDEVELLVAATVMNSVDGAGTDQDWDLTGTEVRYFDADGVATDDDDADELPTGGPAEFSIEERGGDDGADLESSSADPDEALIKVETDTDESDEYTVFVFDIEVDEDSSDLEMDDVYLDVTVSNPDSGTPEDTTVAQVISDIYMIIDGEEVDGDDLGDLNDDDDTTDDTEIDHVISGAGDSNVVTYKFEFDGLELEGDTDYEVEVVVVFEGQNQDALTDDYSDGVTIQIEADSEKVDYLWEVQGLDDDNVLRGSAQSEVHTLQAVVPTITDVRADVEADDPNDSGTISFEFTIAANDDDGNVVLNFADVDAALDGADADLLFSITGRDDTIATALLSKVSGDATVDTVANTWTILENDEATFALDVAFTTLNADDDGIYRVTLESVAGVEVDETSAGLSLSF